MDLMTKGFLYGTLGQILTFVQVQGSLKWGWFDKYPLYVASFGVVTSYIFMLSVDAFIKAFNGELWPSRLIGFGIGVIVFSGMSTIMFNEHFSIKTGVCLILAILLVLLQVFWK